MKYERKIVKSYIDANKLMKMGFICLGVETNIKDTSKLIFWFKNTKELNEVLQKISDNFKKNN
ncbi:hypothetical protein [Clostridium sp.]|uniref:hypothetical protein n=1 Tax=Clostridium sp. TaxID=1506 RepID=UPI002840CEE0|nr:hypothetical protein [Clostridium sp.]MDR3594237.1 hypothetical protein [Clostridium sp.]